MINRSALALTSLVIALVLFFPTANRAEIPPSRQLISESSLLSGLAPGALFPFIDSTPNISAVPTSPSRMQRRVARREVLRRQISRYWLALLAANW